MLLDSMQALYAKQFPKATISFTTTPALDAIHSVTNGSNRIAIVARDYTPEERDALLAVGADSIPRAILAYDALVVVADKAFPYDTMNAEHIRAWLAGDNTVLSSYPKLKKTPRFIVPGGSSGSVYGNVVNVVTNRKGPTKGTVVSIDNRDSLSRVLHSSPESYLGFGLLSQYVRDSSVKLLRLSYTDTTGEHVWPKPVHSAYLMMRQYPFPVPIYVYLTGAPRQYDLASGYMQFITRDGNVQRLFFDWGIEPGYAEIKLYKED